MRLIDWLSRRPNRIPSSQDVRDRQLDRNLIVRRGLLDLKLKMQMYVLDLQHL
jgi:hypothetical protein